MPDARRGCPNRTGSSNRAWRTQHNGRGADKYPVDAGRHRRIVDTSALRMREATFSVGVALTYAVCAAGAAYAALTWDRPHRLALVSLLAAGTVGGAVVSLLPREQIVRSGYRETFFVGWSVLDLLLVTLMALADGGAGSPLALIFFLPVVFAALSYPLGSVIVVGGATVTAYLGLALTVGGASWSYEAWFTVVLICQAVLCAWQARSHDRQRTALAAVSRADPLTGCLNRRGFEERALAEIDAATRRAGQGAVLLLDVDQLKAVNDRDGHTAGDELLCRVVQTVERSVRPTDAVGRLGGDEFAVLFPQIEPAEALEQARRIVRALGRHAPCTVGVATFPLDGTELEELLRRADVRLYASRHGRHSPRQPSSTERLSWAATLAHALDLRMNADHEHSRSVADYAVAIAGQLGWQTDLLGMLRIAAMLHDVGKVTVPDRILCKPGPLTADEFQELKEHTYTGAMLVAGIEGLELIVPWIRHTHESFDGSGYPDGLCGSDIPQASRILLVADAFDAMTSARPYRQPLTVAHACDELIRHAGTQFDPDCVEALLEFLGASRAVGRRSGLAV